MRDAKLGDRVGAISHTDRNVLFLFGYGVYLGEFHPPKGTPGLFGMDASESPNDNPCILLDSGKIIWGCQCWWGPEEKVKRTVDRYPIVKEKEVPDNPPCPDAEEAKKNLA